MTSMHETTISKREILTFIYKNQRQLAYAFCIPLLLFLLISFIPTPRYKASSMLIIRLGAEYVYNPEVGDTQNGNSNLIPFNTQQIFKSEVAILNSEDLHAKVIDAIGIENLFPEQVTPSIFSHIRDSINSIFYTLGISERPAPEEASRRRIAQAVEIFDKRLDIELEKESAVINLSFENKDASIAIKTLDILLSMYMEKRKTLYSEPRMELANKEMQTSHEHAIAAENAVQQFKLKHSIYSFDEERGLLLDRRDDALKQAVLLNNAGLRRTIDNYNHELAAIDLLERDLALLQKEAQIANEAYALYSHKYDEAKAYEDLQRTRLDSVRVIESPNVPAKPKKLQFLIMLAGIVVSLFSLFSGAAILKFFETGFNNSDQVERILGLKVLATLKQKISDSDKAIRPLVQAVELATQKNPLNTVVFLSARKGEGGSYIALSYATRLAKESGKKVLLINAGHSLLAHHAKGAMAQNGIIDVIAADQHIEEAIHEKSGNLSVCRLVCNEQNHSKTGQILSAEGFWKTLAKMFSSIVIDAGSLEASHESVMLASRADAAIIVVEAEKTPQAAIKNLRDILNNAGAKIEGVVINKYCHYIPDKIYSML